MENIIKKFTSNKKNNNPYIVSRKIYQHVVFLSNTNTSNQMINNFSKIFNIPKNVLKIKYKKLIHECFDYNTSKFKKKIFISNIFFESLKSLILFFILLFAQKNENIENYDFIINGIEDKRSYERYEKLIKKFSSSLVISNLEFGEKSNKVNFLKLSKFNQINKKAINGKKSKLFFVFVKIFIKSIINNLNYIYFFNILLYSMIKNFSTFYNHRARFFMEDRFYNTCSIKNFYFKKFGGKVTSTPQKNIVETSISFFIDIDIFFSLADEKFSLKRLRKFGGRVDKSYPIGSFFLEHDWYRKKKDLSKVPSNKILITGLNPNTWLLLNNLNFKNHEFVCRKWIKDISKLYPKFKIMIKHHSNLRDNTYEKKFFKNSNVISQIDPNSNNSSYGYIYKSEIILSFASTTILEAISMGKQGFFIDPGNASKNFFYNLNNLDKIRVSSFEGLIRIIKKNLFHKTKKKFNKNKYCLKSDRVTDCVFNYYKKIK